MLALNFTASLQTFVFKITSSAKWCTSCSAC